MMKRTQLIFLGLASFGIAAGAARSQTAPATTPAYVNENAQDPAPLKLDELSGKVVGLGGDAMPRVTISLFTEQEHTLLSTVVTDNEGKFKLDKVPHGLYRVVATVAGLCPANIPVKLESSLIRHKLEITMRPKGLDTCSYGMAKK
jgi:Carboxypeptidase regulatory-like domain